MNCYLLGDIMKTYKERKIKDMDGDLFSTGMIEDPDGEWVKKQDAQAAIDVLQDIIEDIQGDECPQCHRIKSYGSSSCPYCDWDVEMG
jgi:hypothetical protein